MTEPISAFFHYLSLSAPLFGVVVVGYAVARLRGWQRHWTELASKLVFAIPLPALLFHMLSTSRSALTVDARLLIAFFGGCFIVFVIGRLIASWLPNVHAVQDAGERRGEQPGSVYRARSSDDAALARDLRRDRLSASSYATALNNRRVP